MAMHGQDISCSPRNGIVCVPQGPAALAWLALAHARMLLHQGTSRWGRRMTLAARARQCEAHYLLDT